MKKVSLLFALFLLFITSYGQNENDITRMLGESILKSKNKYENSPYLAYKNPPLLLCSDGLPNRYAQQNRTFYENIGLETMSWHNTTFYQEKMIQGIDVMEVSYYLKGNIFEVYIHFLTATEENNEIFLAYWFESIDKYIYEYSCETNEWRLVEE